jgi:hypothetical protein
MAVRIIMPWVPVIIIMGIIDIFAGPPDAAAQEISTPVLVQLLTGLASLLAVCSIGVSWNRFILRDEAPSGLRFDSNVLLYAGNTILMLMAMFLPAAITLTGALAAPVPAMLLGLAAMVLIGGVVTRLSIKLPAVALGNSAFGFRDAWAASAGNFWPCVAVFLLNLVIAAGGLLALIVLASLFSILGETAGSIVIVAGAAVLQLLLAILNASIFTSLYGFFVERRDF